MQFQSNLLSLAEAHASARPASVLYENPTLQESTDFGARHRHGGRRRRRASRTSTINARDLVNLTNVQIGESRRRDGASTSWSTQLARDVYLYSVEAF